MLVGQASDKRVGVAKMASLTAITLTFKKWKNRMAINEISKYMSIVYKMPQRKDQLQGVVKWI